VKKTAENFRDKWNSSAKHIIEAARSPQQNVLCNFSILRNLEERKKVQVKKKSSFKLIINCNSLMFSI
jgi:hypothetical protein